jgi:hypothetical protein
MSPLSTTLVALAASYKAMVTPATALRTLKPGREREIATERPQPTTPPDLVRCSLHVITREKGVLIHMIVAWDLSPPLLKLNKMRLNYLEDLKGAREM